MLPQWAALFVLVFARVGTLVMLLPGLGERFAPARVRLGLGLALTLVFLPFAGPLFKIDVASGPGIIGALLVEIATGLTLGMSARLIVATLQTAGMVIAQDLQLSFAQTVDPTAGTQGAAIGNLLTIVGVTLIFVTDLHHLAISAIGASYTTMPPGMPPDTGDAASLILRTLASSFSLAVKIAAPFAVFAIVFNVGLGMLARMMPALQIFFLAMPVSVMFGMLLLAAVIGVMMGGFLDEMGRFLRVLNGG